MTTLAGAVSDIAEALYEVEYSIKIQFGEYPTWEELSVIEAAPYYSTALTLADKVATATLAQD